METFDIFGRLPGGKPLWIEAVAELDAAQKHANHLSRTFGAEYFIYSEKAGRVVERINAQSKRAGQPNG